MFCIHYLRWSQSAWREEFVEHDKDNYICKLCDTLINKKSFEKFKKCGCTTDLYEYNSKNGFRTERIVWLASDKEIAREMKRFGIDVGDMKDYHKDYHERNRIRFDEEEFIKITKEDLLNLDLNIDKNDPEYQEFLKLIESNKKNKFDNTLKIFIERNEY